MNKLNNEEVEDGLLGTGRLEKEFNKLPELIQELVRDMAKEARACHLSYVGGLIVEGQEARRQSVLEPEYTSIPKFMMVH
jgi:hypothetical protein